MSDPAPPTPLPALRSSPFTARDHELSQLVQALRARPAVIEIEGEAGVGKSRLLAELLAHPAARTKRVLAGRCHPLRDPFPLGAVVDALRALRERRTLPTLSPVTGALLPLLPEIAHLLPSQPAPLADSRAARHQLYRAVHELLSALGPCVLALEDLHWADEMTRELLGFLTASLPEDVALVVTYRPEDLPPSAPLRGALTRVGAEVARVHLVLAPFDVAGVAAFVAAVLGAPSVSEEFAAHVRTLTAGIAFAVEEFLRLLHGRADLVHEDGRWLRRLIDEVQVPPAVRDMVLQRAGWLSGHGQVVLEAAAVLGRDATQAALEAATGLSSRSVATALAEAFTAALLSEGRGGAVEFRHALAAQAVYEAIPTPQRRRLHLEAAHAVERTAPDALGRLAHHYQHANEAAAWARCAEAAADASLELGDDAGAAAFLASALESAALTELDRGRVAGKLGMASLHCLAHDDAIPVVRGVLGSPHIPADIAAELRLSLGWLQFQAGCASDAFASVRAAVSHLGHAPGLQARAMSTLAMPWVEDGSIEQHLEWLDRAIVTAGSSSDAAVRTAVMIDRAYLLLSIGHPEADAAVDEVPWQAQSIEQQRQLTRGRLNLAEACFHLGRDRDARRFHAEGSRLCEELRYERLKVGFETLRLRLDWAAGEWSGLEQRARLLAGQDRTPTDTAEVDFVSGSLALARGQLATAESSFTRAVDGARRTGTFPLYAVAAAALALIAHARGDLQTAHSWAERCLAPSRAKGVWVWAAEAMPTVVEVELARGGAAAAEDVVEEFAAGMHGRRVPAADAALAYCRGLLDGAHCRWQAAAAELRRAAERWRALPRPRHAARAEEALACCLLEAGDPAGGELLRAALHCYGRIGASRDADRVRWRLRGHGLATTYRGGRRGYGPALSPREREVAGLVAAGHSDREIAGVLFVSPRTASNHVGSILRKLGLASRHELTATMLEAIRKPTIE